jgi:hypothetical protein
MIHHRGTEDTENLATDLHRRSLKSDLRIIERRNK